MKWRQMVIGLLVLLVAAAVLVSFPLVVGSARADDGFVLPKVVPSCMVKPVYPPQEAVDGIAGTVYLNVEVKSEGTIGGLKAEREVEGHPAFTAAAIAAVGKWCFEPALKDGRAVACTVTIPVKFALEEKTGKTK